MIPEIGIMIGSYIAFRCIESFCMAGSRFSGSTPRAVTGIAAGLALLVTVVIVLTLMAGSGTSLPRQ